MSILDLLIIIAGLCLLVAIYLKMNALLERLERINHVLLEIRDGKNHGP